MKKFYLALVAMAAAFSAQAADYYLIGGFNGWTTSDASCKFTDNGDGTYVLDYAGELTPGFKVNDGTWTNANANFGSNGSNLVVGTPYKYNVGASTGNIMMDGNVADPHIVLDINAGTLTIGGEEVEATYSYALHGDVFNIGSTNWTSIEMVETDGKWVSENTRCEGGDFGIRKNDAGTGAQVNWIWGATGANNVVLDQPMTCYVEGEHDGKNWHFGGSGNYNFVFDPEAMTLTVSKVGGGDDPIVDEHEYDIWGQIGGESNWGSLKMTKNDDNLWEFTGNIEPGEFGIRQLKNGSQVNWIAASDGNIVDATGDFACKINGINFSSTLEGSYTITYDPSTMTLSVAEYGGEIVEVYSYVLRGSIFTGEWTDKPMTQVAGIWTVTATIVPGKFGFKKVDQNGAQKAWLAAPNEAGSAVDAPGHYDLGDFGTTDFNSTLEGEYSISIDPDDMTMTVTNRAGVTEVIDLNDNAPVEYFNLQGVRVANPENGLYIRRQGNKVTKVVL